MSRRSGKTLPHPMQPVYTDSEGTYRFKANAIVRYMLDLGFTDLNKLAIIPFSAEDREQFAQLIGYSVSGFGELSYVRDSTYARIVMPKKKKTRK